MTIKLLIAEDHPLMRTAICTTLESDPDILVLDAVGSGQALFTRLENKTPDVLILDLTLPDMHGIEIVNTLRQAYPALYILIFSSSLDPTDISAAVQCGALGYLNKDAHSDELLKAVHTVSQGKAYLPPTVATTLVKELHHASPAMKAHPLDQLTQRERQMLQLLAEGMSNQQLAQEMSISEETVRTHLHNIFKKLPIENRSQLILYAINNKTYL